MKTVARMLTALIVVLGVALPAVAAQQVFFDDFETGGTDWITDNGIWEVGTPTAGPPSAHSGSQCAGTVLDGNYFSYDDSRLIYPKASLPPLTLPPIVGDEELRLRYWLWLSYAGYDYMYVQVSYWDAGTSSWTTFEDIPGTKIIDSAFTKWHLRDVDLTPYAGKDVRIGFFHTANRKSWADPSESTGLYIDDVEIVKKVPQFYGDFEASLGDWVVEDALWEVGLPTSGPGGVYGGRDCSGTMLNGKYQGYRDSRLISPSTWLPEVTGNEKLFMSFYQWWSYSTADAGFVQVSAQDPVTGDWSAWSPAVPGSTVSGVSAVWALNELELTAYAGQKVRIAFHHTANRVSWADPSESTGWYLDDIQITGVNSPPRRPTVDVKVNGLDGPVFLTPADGVSVAIALEAADYLGAIDGELWVGALTEFGVLWHDGSGWTPVPTSYVDDRLDDVTDTIMLDRKLPEGVYTFFAVLDVAGEFSNPYDFTNLYCVY